MLLPSKLEKAVKLADKIQYLTKAFQRYNYLDLEFLSKMGEARDIKKELNEFEVCPLCGGDVSG